MPRIARLVVVDCPHHITQRGNRGQRVFFSDTDYRSYLTLLEKWSKQAGLAIWSFCLLPNHVHLIGVPKTERSLKEALREAHRRYACLINNREGRQGYLWQGRFFSFPMDEAHTWNALHYIESNPVRAGLVERPEDWPWSSAVARTDSGHEWNAFLSPLPNHLADSPIGGYTEQFAKEFARHESTGRPLGSDVFIKTLESRYQRSLAPQKRGPKTPDK